MMHVCRIIKNSLHPSQIVPFAKLHHSKNGKQKSSIQHKRDDTSSNPPAILTSQKKLKTGHSLILIIPNSIFFPGFSLISKRERSHIPPAPPHPRVSTSENPCASGPRLDSRWTGCGVMRKSKPHFRSWPRQHEHAGENMGKVGTGFWHGRSIRAGTMWLVATYSLWMAISRNGGA